MKIEKISDSQIRCTLSKEDLFDRELKLSELAYGTEKAKALFRDMMQQASYEFGFGADDIPLMIEAVPVSGDALVLVITKVEDPDELDTRFSKFSADSNEQNFYSESDNSEDTSYADEIINCFGQLESIIEGTESSSKNKENNSFIPLEGAIGSKSDIKKNKPKDEAGSVKNKNITKVYSFNRLEEVIRLANILVFSYKGENKLYKNTSSGSYYLVVNKTDHTPEEFNKVCNVISEYGKPERTTYASLAYYQEHFERIVKEDAIAILSVM